MSPTGYTTDFSGEITIEPPLNEHEVSYLREFASTRRMSRHKGPYFVKGSDAFGQSQDPDIIDYNNTGCVTEEWVDNPKYDPSRPGYAQDNPVRIRRALPTPICPPEIGSLAQMPGLWCQWVPTADGSALEWDGNEKFYEPTEWMWYLIRNFLQPNAFALALPHIATTYKSRELVELAGETERFSHFTFDHICNGVIDAQGEESDDTWRLVVADNLVSVQYPTVIWPDLPKSVRR